jgi:hypothetical protein
MQNLAVFLVKKRQSFCNFFGENILKIKTSVPEIFRFNIFPPDPSFGTFLSVRISGSQNDHEPRVTKREEEKKK